MQTPVISLKKLTVRKVAQVVASIESDKSEGSWTDRFAPSGKIGMKGM